MSTQPPQFESQREQDAINAYYLRQRCVELRDLAHWHGEQPFPDPGASLCFVMVAWAGPFQGGTVVPTERLTSLIWASGLADELHPALPRTRWGVGVAMFSRNLLMRAICDAVYDLLIRRLADGSVYHSSDVELIADLLRTQAWLDEQGGR